MTIRDAIRRDHRTLWGYPSLLLGVWLLSLVLMSGGAWFAQEWRYRDLAQRGSGDAEADRPVYLSNGQMQVVSGQDVRVYMTSDETNDSAEYATEERRYRDKHPFQNSVHTRATPSGTWRPSSPSHLPDFRPLQ